MKRLGKISRGFCIAALLGLSPAFVTQASAQKLGTSVTGLLANASDSALDKLAQPNAFYADEAVRILLPGTLGKAAGLMKLTDQLGVTNGLTKSLNDAAGLAASEAKPIFRNAINQMTLKDGINVFRQNDGATRYLRDSAGTELKTKIRPLIANALGKVGAFEQLDKLSGQSSLLSGAGVSRDSLTDSVSEQTLSGIFKYIGTEETRLRANPLDAGKKFLKGFKR